MTTNHASPSLTRVSTKPFFNTTNAVTLQMLVLGGYSLQGRTRSEIAPGNRQDSKRLRIHSPLSPVLHLNDLPPTLSAPVSHHERSQAPRRIFAYMLDSSIIWSRDSYRAGRWGK